MSIMWGHLMTSEVSIAEKALRTVAVYLFLVAGLRLFGKRELGQLNPLDVIVLLLLANTVQNAIIGNDDSLAGGLVGAAVLFVLNAVLVRLAYRNPRVRRLIEGRAEEVIRDGHVLPSALRRNLITREELEAAARKQGIDHLKDVECAHLEVSGAITFAQREPSTIERSQAEILSRLSSIEKRLAASAKLALLIASAGVSAAGTTALGSVGAHVLFARSLGAQARPSTDVWVAPLRGAGAALALGEPVNLTHRTGYDNQPAFTARGDAVLYTVIGADGSADIWRVAVPGGTPERLTATAESEYSATVTPDGQYFSVIRVEADSTQRLWKFPFAGGAPSLVLPAVKPVGYHAWATEHLLVLFVLGPPVSTLQIADDRGGAPIIVARDIGRALAKVPGTAAVTFLQQARDSAAWITEVNATTRATRRVAVPPAGADYHLWTPDGVLLAASGSIVYRFAGGRWVAVADLAAHGVKGISRLAISPRGDWLAFVAEDQPPG